MESQPQNPGFRNNPENFTQWNRYVSLGLICSIIIFEDKIFSR